MRLVQPVVVNRLNVSSFRPSIQQHKDEIRDASSKQQSRGCPSHAQKLLAIFCGDSGLAAMRVDQVDELERNDGCNNRGNAKTDEAKLNVYQRIILFRNNQGYSRIISEVRISSVWSVGQSAARIGLIPQRPQCLLRYSRTPPCSA